MASRKILIWIFIFDAIAFVLAIAAELNRNIAKVKQDSEYNYNFCVYGSNIATMLGTNAAMCLLTSQVIALESSQWLIFKSAISPQVSMARSIVLRLTCLVTLLAAEACLLFGSVENLNHTKYRTIFSEDMKCHMLQKGVFGAGAVFVLFNGIVSLNCLSLLFNDKESLQVDSADASEKSGGDYMVLADDAEKAGENPA
ncbi:hypothetical protein ACFE04_024321 [Oxalis oulophora]